MSSRSTTPALVLRRLFLAAATATFAAHAAVVTYRNPVIPGFHPDPSICRNGDDYYLATSTFEYFPGVPIFHSKDLVHWRQIGHALTRESQLKLAGARSSGGIYAPTLRCNQGHFWLIATNVTGGGNFIVHADDPAGPWSDPVWIREENSSIDPSLLFDDDGKVYFTRQDHGERGGISQAEIDPATGTLKGEAKRIWNGTGGIWPEGPHLYKIGGWYYLMIAEGGTSYGHAITLARSKSPWGPFESAPNNPIVTHRDLPAQVLQATGHGDLVQTPDGNWFMVLLGIRPQGRNHHLGRETLLAPVTVTDDGWLTVNGGRPLSETMQAAGLPAPHPWPAAPVRDAFDAPVLGLEWTFVRGPGNGLYSLTDKPGTLRINGRSVSLDDVGTPAFIARRQEHLRLRAAALLDFAPVASGQEAGLALRMNEKNHYRLVVAAGPSGRTIRLVTRVKGVTTVVREAPIDHGKVELSVRAEPDRYVFGYRIGRYEVRDFGSAPTAALSSEQAGGFTGVFIGMLATGAGARADVDWFDYEPANDRTTDQ
jgi:alpha-N-arabinofuranosidase